MTKVKPEEHYKSQKNLAAIPELPILHSQRLSDDKCHRILLTKSSAPVGSLIEVDEEGRFKEVYKVVSCVMVARPDDAGPIYSAISAVPATHGQVTMHEYNSWKKNGDLGAEFPPFPQKEWVEAVERGTTLKGYDDWVYEQLLLGKFIEDECSCP